MAQAYQSRIADAVPGLPEQARTSLAATYAALERGGIDPAAAQRIAAGANDAFIGAMHVTAYVAAAVSVVGLIVVARFFPGRQRASVEARQDEAVAVPAGEV
jgi:hypothetical protein